MTAPTAAAPNGKPDAEPEPVAVRCAKHPARPAVDECPVCARPRCGADAEAAPGGGCLVCGGTTAPSDTSTHILRSPAERLIAGALVAYFVGLLGAPIASEYVGSQGFAEIVPFLLGLVCAAGAAIVTRTGGRGRLDVATRAIGGVAAVLATAFSFRLVPGGESPFTPLDDVGVPYLCAIAGAAASRLFR